MKPLFMWAGGKTKLLKHYQPYLPSYVTHYHEPFFGGGAMFIYVMKRYRPRAKGRASPIKKPFSRITVVLEEKKNTKEGK